MTIEDAVRELTIELQQFNFVSSVGLGKFAEKEIIIIYVTNNQVIRDNALSGLSRGWKGFPVMIKKSGQVRPC